MQIVGRIIWMIVFTGHWWTNSFGIGSGVWTIIGKKAKIELTCSSIVYCLLIKGIYVLYLSGGLEIGPSLLVSLKAMLSTPNRKKR